MTILYKILYNQISYNELTDKDIANILINHLNGFKDYFLSVGGAIIKSECPPYEEEYKFPIMIRTTVATPNASNYQPRLEDIKDINTIANLINNHKNIFITEIKEFLNNFDFSKINKLPISLEKELYSLRMVNNYLDAIVSNKGEKLIEISESKLPDEFKSITNVIKHLYQDISDSSQCNKFLNDLTESIYRILNAFSNNGYGFNNAFLEKYKDIIYWSSLKLSNSKWDSKRILKFKEYIDLNLLIQTGNDFIINRDIYKSFRKDFIGLGQVYLENLLNTYLFEKSLNKNLKKSLNKRMRSNDINLRNIIALKNSKITSNIDNTLVDMIIHDIYFECEKDETFIRETYFKEYLYCLDPKVIDKYKELIKFE